MTTATTRIHDTTTFFQIESDSTDWQAAGQSKWINGRDLLHAVSAKKSIDVLNDSGEKPIDSRDIDAFRFRDLAARWKTEKVLMSSVADICTLPSYQQIIGMGKTAIPLILQELEETPDHWFWALSAITGENPIRDEDRGRVSKMTESWLNWGCENGYK